MLRTLNGTRPNVQQRLHRDMLEQALTLKTSQSKHAPNEICSLKFQQLCSKKTYSDVQPREAQHTQLLIFKRNLRSIIRWFANDLC